MQVEIKPPYLLFLGDEPGVGHVKTAMGIAFWRPDACLGQLRLPGSGVDLGLPDMTPEEAALAGVKTLIWGVAGVGGMIPEHWTPTLFSAVEAGLDVCAGTHTSLTAVPGLEEAAKKAGVRLIDIRTPPKDLPVGTGERRSGKRLLMAGTDCVVGKKFSALAIAKEMTERGMKADFRATGQTGIMISGGGMPIDAVVSDFVSGAAELLSPANDDDHWDVIEGQGSLFHPGYSAVTLGLLHGSQPDAFVVCNEVGRETIDAYPDFPVPSIEELIKMTVAIGRVTNPDVRCVGVSLITSSLSEAERHSVLSSTADEIGLPCVDPVATGVAPIVDYLNDTFGGIEQ
tara:strand:+ start:170 stop:1198 length:1029 start_codon:yes stop_codon:yes gene_type:complete